MISKALSGDDRYKNRLRTTLSHEYGHVHYHAYLWNLEPPRADLLRQSPNADKQICKRDSILDARETDWMEWQAGYVCGALLMPVKALRNLVRQYQEAQGLYGPVGINDSHGQRLIEATQKAFEVSADAARVRLIKLKVLGAASAGPSLFNR
jgi:Zn-dependent peptidase ImmA (M78 family)